MLKTIICIKQAYSQEVTNGVREYFRIYKKPAEIRATVHDFQSIKDLVDTQENGGKDFLIILSELDDGTDIVELTSFLRRQLFNCHIIFISQDKNLLEPLTNHSTMISGFYGYPFIDEDFQNGLDGVFMSLNARGQEDPKEKFLIECIDPKTNTKKIMYKSPDEILYIEATQKKIKYVTKDLIYSKELSKHRIKYNEDIGRGSLSTLVKSLDAKIFYRCHNAYIINIHAIREYRNDTSEIVMANGDRVSVSRGKKKHMLELMDMR